jgi:hypothetical protein
VYLQPATKAQYVAVALLADRDRDRDRDRLMVKMVEPPIGLTAVRIDATREVVIDGWTQQR